MVYARLMVSFAFSRIVLNERHTSGNVVNFVLNEEVEQRYDCCKESGGKYLPVLDRFGIRWAEFDTTDGPGYGCQKVRDHEDVMPTMVIS